MRHLFSWLLSKFRKPPEVADDADQTSPPAPRIHVVILDGTQSNLIPGHETNAGLALLLTQEMIGSDFNVIYRPGIQFSTETFTSMFNVLIGRGLNKQICDAYGALASKFRAGDQVYLLGFSRGAFAVRSLAGIIDRVGLLRSEHATHRQVMRAFRHYKRNPDGDVAQSFSDKYCHDYVCIKAIGVWDTVKALGIRLPFIWRAFDGRHKFHNHQIAGCVESGFHALALDETRVAFTPVMWETRADWPGHLKQMWFRGNHGDVGGHLGGRPATRPLSNIPFVWMMTQLGGAGLPLPKGWEDRFPMDHRAPSWGNWTGGQKFFLLREPRVVGGDPSESLHPTVNPRNHDALRGLHDASGR
ncbi:MAG: DUF2235 domain-containing protein [Planktomarina sp.]